jgi:hypothetical protein
LVGVPKRHMGDAGRYWNGMKVGESSIARDKGMIVGMVAFGASHAADSDNLCKEVDEWRMPDSGYDSIVTTLCAIKFDVPFPVTGHPGGMIGLPKELAKEIGKNVKRRLRRCEFTHTYGDLSAFNSEYLEKVREDSMVLY